MDKKQRKERILRELSRLIDNQLILEFNRFELHTLIGIKNSLIGPLKCSDSHEESVERIKLKRSTKSLPISELDRLRLKHIILPSLEDIILGWDSACHQVLFGDALELFSADLEYLLSKDLRDRLPAQCLAARDKVLVNIRTTRIHPRFGTGTKVSYRQYGKLIAATQGGWVSHLVELGVSLEFPSDTKEAA